MQALHAKKLEQALRSHERFPVNLEWMVDVFKYKHISSLTTHLKRHFKMNVHYKRFAQEQNKRVWTYFISVDCFIGICEYVRHAARKKIANLWLRKVGVKGSSKRQSREYDYSATSEEEEAEEEGEEEEVASGEYEFYQDEDEDEDAPPTVRRRRRDDDEEFRVEDDGDDSDRSFFTQDGEEDDDSSSFPADSEDDGSLLDYDSSSSSNFDTPPLRHRVAALTVSGGFSPTTFSRTLSNPSISFSGAGGPNIANYRSLSFSGASSSGASSPSSSPSSPILPRVPRMTRSQQNAAYNSNYFPAGNFTPPKPHPLSGSNGMSPLSGSQGMSPLSGSQGMSPLSGSQGMTRTPSMGFSSSLSPSPSTAPPPPFASSPIQSLPIHAPVIAPSPVPTIVPNTPVFAIPSTPLPIPSTPAVPIKPEPTAEVSTPTEQVDWGYLMLRPSPPAGSGANLSDLSGKYLTSLLMSNAFFTNPQQQFVTSFGTNGYYPSANLHNTIHAHSHGMESVHGFPGRSVEPFGDLPGLPHMDDLAFDTNVFLS